eukprot:TRINITY_DN1289_c0_g1_i5.p1 TRINITY_DN1289_c0_g1~~TRINITY_DN1289_c0_g1_i5.p1  ORF type:complete len:454 (+),score=49.23 TRINITY_DN1289_c0_g1_i5:47-1363(+)
MTEDLKMVPLEEEDEKTDQPITASDQLTASVVSVVPSVSDRYFFVGFTITLLGIGQLLPYNSLINAVDYFELLFPNKQVQMDIVISYLVPNLLGLLLVIKYGQRISFSSRLIFGFALFLTLTVILPFVEVLASKELFFWWFITICVLYAIIDAIIITALYGYVNVFPPKYLIATQMGNGISSVISSFLRIMTKISFKQDQEGLRKSTLVYFITSAVLLLLCIVCYIISYKTPFSRTYVSRLIETLQEDHTDTNLSTDKAVDSKDWRKQNEQRINYTSIFRRIWQPLIAIWFNFFVTLTLFPGLIAEIDSDERKLQNNSWFTVILFSIFNISDVIGKFLPFWKILPDTLIYIITYSRVIYYPLYVLCIKPRVFQHYSIPVVITFFFGLSNGYAGCVLLSLGTLKVDVYERETASSILVFSLLLGLAAGGGVGYFWKFLV